MRKLRNEFGSMLSLSVGLLVILIFSAMGALNVGYLVASRFQLQSELDALALQLVQQVDYEQYFLTGFTQSLEFDMEAIEQGISNTQAAGRISKCNAAIVNSTQNLEIDLALDCPVKLPLPMPGLPESVVLQLRTSARLAQSTG